MSLGTLSLLFLLVVLIVILILVIKSNSELKEVNFKLERELKENNFKLERELKETNFKLKEANFELKELEGLKKFKDVDSKIYNLSKCLLNANINLKELNNLLDNCEKYKSLSIEIESEINKEYVEYEEIKKHKLLHRNEVKECLNRINKLELTKKENIERLEEKYTEIYNYTNNVIFKNNIESYSNNRAIIKAIIEELQNEQIKSQEKQKQKALEQHQNDAAEQIRANEDAMRKNEVERDIDELLGGYIDTLGVSIQKKELPDVQMVSELSKILDLILNKKSYISKEYFNKVRDDNEVFIKHILEKCSELEKFSGTLLETRMLQVKAKFDEILK